MRILRLNFLILFFLAFATHGHAASGGKQDGTKTMVVLGDSIAAGYGLDPDEAFPALLQKKAHAAGYKITVKNAGVSGDTTAGGLRRVNWLLKQKVDYLLVELGGNDGLRGVDPAETARNLEGIIQRARQLHPEITIIIAGMQMPANMGEAYTTAFKETFKTVAEKNKCVLIPFLLEGVGGRTDLNQPDRIHPTAEGQKRIAETVWKVVQPLFASRPAS